MRWSILVILEMVTIFFYECPVAAARSCHASSTSVRQPYPNDCSRYYLCYNGEWVVKTCPEDYRFDVKSYQCLSAHKVECALEQNKQKTNFIIDKPNKRNNVYIDTKNTSFKLEPVRQHRLPRAGSKRRASWTTYYLNGEPTHTVITFYQSDGPSYKIKVPGKLPKDTNVIEWVQQNGDRYEKEFIPYVEESTSSNANNPPPPPPPPPPPASPININIPYPTESPSILLKPVNDSYVHSTYPPYPTRRIPSTISTTTYRAPTTTIRTTRYTTTTTTPPPSTYGIFRPRPPIAESEDFDMLPKECGLNLHGDQDKILHGSISPIEDNPWQVALLEEETKIHLCGGSIITNRHVLTAAHCFWIPRMKSWRPPNEVIVRVGDYDKQEVEESEKEYFIEELYRHTKYSASHRRNDIALITVLGTMTFSVKIFPICIPPKAVEYSAGLECIISGWGDTESARVPKRYLRSAFIKIVAQTECIRSYINNTITRGMFCAGDILNGGVDTCQGDSGGPFVCRDRGRHYLYGITGWGIGCGLKGRPGVYTRVALYRDWIFNKLELSTWNQKSAQEDEDIL